MKDLVIDGSTFRVNCNLRWEIEGEFVYFCERLLESDSDEVVIDLIAATFVASPFMSRLVKLHSEAEGRGKSLKIVISPALQELFDMAGLISYLNVEIAETGPDN